MHLKQPDHIFTSRNDPADPRLGDLCKQRTLASEFPEKYVLVGYPDDEGIKLNGGRIGAALAPDKIRHFFYKMTPDLFAKTNISVCDLGNLTIEDPLAVRHQNAQQLISQIYAAGKTPLTLGGGHDYAYPDIAAFIEKYKNQNPLVINWDAHLDVRSPKNGFNSGTPFHRLLTDYKNQFELIELGIQSQCNSKEHLNWALQQGAYVIPSTRIETEGLLNVMKPFLQLQRPCFLSVDIDGFTSSEAPGCSQSWTSGLSLREFNPFLKMLHEKVNIQGLGIYEVSPTLDQDDRTSKLAALILHQFVHL